MAKYVAYYRVSTSKQGQSGLGLEAQREAVARHIGPSSAIAEFVEVESGKASKNRPQLQAALTLCRDKKAILIIAKLDRLSRNVHFLSGVLESKIEFVAVDNPHATKTMLQLLAVFAEHEAAMISVRTKAALQAAKARGTILGNPKWEASLIRARQVKNPTPISAAVVQMMQECRANGMPLRAVADKLNGLNIRTPKGKIWYACTVSSALSKAA